MARFSLGTVRFLPADYQVEIAEVNGQAAVIIRTGGQALFVLSIEVEAGQIQAIRIIANPEKLARIYKAKDIREKKGHLRWTKQEPFPMTSRPMG